MLALQLRTESGTAKLHGATHPTLHYLPRGIPHYLISNIDVIDVEWRDTVSLGASAVWHSTR